MAHLVQEARGDFNKSCHCGICGKVKLLKDVYFDNYGAWCPECGGDIHSYDKDACALCKLYHAAEER
jgi:hypothetical protein